MSLTFVDTGKIEPVPTREGTLVEVLSERVCGAKKVRGWIRQVDPGRTLAVDGTDTHQLVYLLEGAAAVSLDNKSYDVEKGAGLYLAPNESAELKASARGAKVFHLAVPPSKE